MTSVPCMQIQEPSTVITSLGVIPCTSVHQSVRKQIKQFAMRKLNPKRPVSVPKQTKQVCHAKGSTPECPSPK